MKSFVLLKAVKEVFQLGVACGAHSAHSAGHGRDLGATCVVADVCGQAPSLSHLVRFHQVHVVISFQCLLGIIV